MQSPKASALATICLAFLTSAEKWENPDGGNFVISTSDTNINWGSVNPVDVVGKLKNEGCQATFCDSIDESTTMVSGGKSDFKTVKLIVKDSLFNDNSPGTMSEMIEVLFKIVSNGNFVKTFDQDYANPELDCPPPSNFCDGTYVPRMGSAHVCALDYRIDVPWSIQPMSFPSFSSLQ